MSTTPQQALDAQRGRGAGGTGATGGEARRSAQDPPAPLAADNSSHRRNRRSAGERHSAHKACRRGRSPFTAGAQGANAQAAGGILAVASKSTQTSMRLYNGEEQIQRVALHGHSCFDPGRGTTGIRWANTWRPRGQSRWSRGRGSRPRRRYINAGRGRARTGRVLAEGRKRELI